MSQPELQRGPAPDEGDGEADDALDPAFVARFGSGPPAVPAWLRAPASVGLAMPDLGATGPARHAAWPAWPLPMMSRAARHSRPRRSAGPGATIARALSKALALLADPRGRRTRRAQAPAREGAAGMAPEGAAPEGAAASGALPAGEAPAAPPPGLAAAAGARDRLAWPLAGLLLGGYLGLLGLAVVAPGVAARGGLGVALWLGLAALTGAVAVLYPRLAAANVDPLAASLAEQVGEEAEQEPGGGGSG